MVPHRFAFRAMAAENEIQVQGVDAATAKRAAGLAIAEVARIESKYSRYKPDSIVSTINARAGGDPVEIDAETAGLLAYASACFRESGGLFDATSGVLRRAWRFDQQRVPETRELESVTRLVGWQHVELDAGSVRLPMAGMELDFGGFGKEYAVDRAALALRDAGCESALVNLAGDLSILGPQPDGTPWQVGIRHPRRDDSSSPRRRGSSPPLLATLPISSGALATSGDYERFIEVDGVRHCHVLDPRTGLSARGFQSVTVHAGSCLVAGSASTIAMLKGRDEGLAWLHELGLPHLCVLEDGAIVDAFRP